MMADFERKKLKYSLELDKLGYAIGNLINKNQFCNVFRLKFGDGSDSFALKIWDKSSLPEGYIEAMFEDPITSFHPLEHPNIARVMQILDFESDILVILRHPRYPRSSLEVEWNNWSNREIPLFLSKKWMHCVAQGLAHLHTHGCAHRNLSAFNILIKSRQTAQISDYSLVPVADQVEPFENCEVKLRPPRTAGQVVDNLKDDVWTFGVILFLLMSQTRSALVKHPVSDRDEWDPKQYNSLLLKTVDEWKKFVFVDSDIPRGAKPLLGKILHIQSEARCTMQEIVDDAWLQSEEEKQAEGVGVINIPSSGERAVKNKKSQVYTPLSDKFRAELKKKGIKRVNYLSRGTYGEVHCVLITEPKLYPNYTQKFAALKICDLGHSDSYREINSVRERELIKNVSHENMIQFIALFEDGSRHICILMELATGDLEGIIAKHFQSKESYKTREPLMKKYLHDVCKGLNHLHSCGWAHRDIKPGNCLVKLNGDAAITDFGFSKNVSDGAMALTYAGTPQFLSPQLILKLPYRPKAADVWALGCSIHRCLSLRSLFNFDRRDTMQKRHNIVMGRDVVVQGASISSDGRDLIYNCLCYNERDRYTMDQVLGHRFFSSLQPEAVGPSSPKPSTSGTSSKLAAVAKEGSKTSSGKPASLEPSTQRTNLPVPRRLHEVKGEKRKREDDDTSSNQN